MTSTIQKWGNSHGIRLPKLLLDDMNLSVGSEVELTVADEAIIIRPIAKTRTIQELFASYDGDYKPQEIDWGAPKGSELW